MYKPALLTTDKEIICNTTCMTIHNIYPFNITCSTGLLQMRFNCFCLKDLYVQDRLGNSSLIFKILLPSISQSVFLMTCEERRVKLKLSNTKNKRITSN